MSRIRQLLSRMLKRGVTRDEFEAHLRQREIAMLQQLQLEEQQRTRRLRCEMLAQRRVLAVAARRRPPPDSTPASLGEVLSLSECYARLHGEAPVAFAHWMELMKVGVTTYEGFPSHSCSVEGHENAAMFRDFIAPYLGGRVLDLGCGPQPVPSYLKDYPAEALYGIDPLSKAEDHPFHFFPGIGEFLPWRDGQFHAVIAATSLDHVLLLDRAFREIHRVLARPGGLFLAWISTVAGSKPYEPYRPGIVPIDPYHLFHFSRDTFEQATGSLFEVQEVFEMGTPYTDMFYALRPR